VDTVQRMEPGFQVIGETVQTLYTRHEHRRLPRGAAESIQNATEELNALASLIGGYAELSPAMQLAKAPDLQKELDRHLANFESLKTTLHLSVSTEMSKDIEEIRKQGQKKGARERVLEARNDGLVKYFIDPTEVETHTDPLRKDEVWSGGFGEVRVKIFKQQTVAVKELVIPPGVTPAKLNELNAGFEKELQTMTTLRDPNICHCFGYTTSTRGYAFVMEFCELGDLRGILDSGSDLTMPIRFKMAVGAAQGLQYMHDKNVLHKDIKSLNIFVTAAYQAKIGDFGVAQLKDHGNTTLAVSTNAPNTPAWSAPERRKGYTTACDVYSFGVVLWELATGEIPFKGMDQVDIIMTICEGERPDDGHPIPPEFPEEFTPLVKACWAQAPADRPEAAAVVEALKRLQRQMR